MFNEEISISLWTLTLSQDTNPALKKCFIARNKRVFFFLAMFLSSPARPQDMLVLLYNEGIWKKGILRCSGKALEVRKLRDYLDSGKLQLPPTRDINVISVAFKVCRRQVCVCGLVKP